MAARKILLAFSIALNVLFILLAALVSTASVTSFAFFGLEAQDRRYTQSAFIVSAPSLGSELSFGPVHFSLRSGAQAALQFSVIRYGVQSNMAMEPLFDRSVVSVRQTGFGLLIAGVSPGETVLQVFSPEGFRDIARIVVY